MNKKALAIISVIIVAAISSAYAYNNLYLIEDAEVHISDSNVTITNSTVTFGENTTITNPTPQPRTESTPTPTPAPTPTPLPNASKTFIVYRWNETHGTVTREMFDEYAAWRTLAKLTLVFTYKLGKEGFVAYYDFYGQGFTVVSEHFENMLSEVADWNKTNVTLEAPYDIKGEHLEYAYLFK